MFIRGGGGACSIREKHVRPSCRVRVRSAKASTGRCLLIGGEGIFERQLRRR